MTGAAAFQPQAFVPGSEPCTECGQRTAQRDWSYVYGLRSRGARPRSGAPDLRPLGRERVRLCARCEAKLVRSGLRELLRRHPKEVAFAALALVGLFVGVSPVAPEEHRLGHPAGVLLAFLPLAAFFGFRLVLRRRRAMVAELFRGRRDALAREHGVAPRELQAYPELGP